MPCYDYHCDKCDLTFEIFRHFTDEDKDEPCPRCSLTSRRIVPQPAIITDTSRGFPKYVVPLGRMIESRAHFEQVKKELGVEETGMCEIGSQLKDAEHKYL